MKRSNVPSVRAFYTVVSKRHSSEVALLMDTPSVETLSVLADKTLTAVIALFSHRVLVDINFDASKTQF